MGEYVIGSGIEIPGLEAILEYGDSSTIVNDSIPGAMRINDRSVLEQVRLSNITGLHDDPDGRDSRQPRSDQHGEDAGVMLYGGRTIGLTGSVRAGSIPAMRDVWRRFRSQFGTSERDLIIHPIGEVPLFINEVANPTLDVDATGWTHTETSGSGTLTGGVASGSLLVGQLAATISSAGGSAVVTPTARSSWDGRDIYVHALVRITAASATVTNLKVGVKFFAFNTTQTSYVTAASSPTLNTWYEISGVISGVAGAVLAATDVALVIECDTSSSGSATMQFDEATMCLIDDVAPIGWIDGSLPGYEWAGTSNASKSMGQSYAANLIVDPLATDPDTWWSASFTGSVTIDTFPLSTPAWHGELSDKSLYYKISSTASGATMGLSNNALVHAMAGRTYRLRAALRVLTNAIGVIDAQLIWKDYNMSEISRTTQSFTGTGVFEVDITGDAPVGTQFVSVVFGNMTNSSTASGQSLELLISDPCLVDVTYFDPGWFTGAGPVDQESIAAPNTMLARKRIARPFLIKGVRKTSDMKAPEQQDGPNAWRDFTMSLRASDPRIYVLDQRMSSVKLTGSPTRYSASSTVGFTLNSGTTPPVPTNWVYEGEFLTNPGGAPYQWDTIAYNAGSTQTKDTHPSFGVSIRSWYKTVLVGQHGTNRPTQDLKARMYHSSATRYPRPLVYLGCAPSAYNSDDAIWINDAGTAYYMTATILLKRVSSTTWLELRWNSLTNAAAVAAGTSNQPHAFELWCSHNTSGTLTTTKLAGWDYESIDPSLNKYPTGDPNVNIPYLVAWIDTNNSVGWELWSAYPSYTDTTMRVESGSYNIPVGLQSVIGSSVDGDVGRSMAIMRGASEADWEALSDKPPYWQYFSVVSYDQPPAEMLCNVIGSIDTFQTIQLRGDLQNPEIQIAVPEFNGSPAYVSRAVFNATILDSNPITIDLSDGSVVDSLGNNSYGLLEPGVSDFAPFRPGINTISISATDWDSSYQQHAIATWRDALA